VSDIGVPVKRIVLAVAVFIGVIGTANAQFKPDTSKYPNLSKPVVLALPNLPDVPQCDGILTQAIVDIATTATVDPAETYEDNRHNHPNMIMMPPPIECASRLWQSLRSITANSVVSVPPGTEALSLRQYPVSSLFDLHALSASVGSNVDPASGVEGYQGETNIAVDPNNPQHLVAFSNTFFKDPNCVSPTGGAANTFGTMALFGSTDGGTTWNYNCAPWPAAITGGVTGATFWFGSDPALAWDSAGRAYATYMLISQSASASGAAIVVARSSDNGATWQSLGTVINGIASTTQGNDKEMMAIDNTTGQSFSHPGRIYVIWDAANAEKIAFSDDGAAWTTVNFPSNTGAIGGNVVVGPDGTVYVIWSRYNVENIVFSKSTDGGATWSAPAVIATLALQSFGTNNFPPAQDKRGINGFGSIDMDRNPSSAFFGNLYVSFPDFPVGTTSGVDLNTYVIRSTNSGASWSSRLKVNDDNFGATQFFPWLAVDQSDGTVNVSWYDSRLDPLNRKTQMVYARSSNGGVSFEPNILVEDGGSAWRNNANFSDENSTDNTAFNGNQYGDYSGIAALNRQVHPLWTDSRMFFPLADTQAPTRREDNATSAVINCAPPSAIAAPSVNSTTAPSVVVSWSAPAGWGTNATNGTYAVYRNTTNVFPGGSPLVSGLTSTNYVDTTGVAATSYFYFVRARNNCPGTALTAMSTDSPASAAVVFGSAGTAAGTLQGTVTAAGNPVSGATVTANSLSATTNGSGFYQLAAIAAGTYTVTASAPGYTNGSANGVVVTANATTVQDLVLTPTASSACFTDTTFSDFAAGTGTNVDLSTSPGDVKLASNGGEAPDQVSSPAALQTTNSLSATTWTGQTFRAGITGNLTKLTVGLGLASGTSGTITVEIRNLNGITPGTTVLATSTLGPVTNVGTAALYTTTFTTPAAVVSGTSYSIVLRTSVGSTVFGVRGSTAGGSSLANGQVFTTTNSGTLWTGVAADLWFTSFVTPSLTYQAAGTFSALKDSGSVAGSSATWTTLSWTATTPANTTIKFQAAGSNNAGGPFNFVGPDGTAATFFTVSGASLSQFNGQRYLQYKAFLSTTDNTVTPLLSDVTVCEQVIDCTPSVPAITPAPAQVCASSTGNSASGPAGVSTYAWGISNGTITSATNAQSVTYTAGASGNVTLTLTITNSSGCTAANSIAVLIATPATPTITPSGPATFCAGGSVTLTSSSATGNQWYESGSPIGGATSQQYVATASGNYTVIASASGCPSAPSAVTAVTVNPLPATPTITPGGPTTFCAGGSVTLTSSSASGNQWFLNGNPIGGATNQTYNATASGSYTVNVTDGNSCTSAASSAVVVTVNPIPATPAITPSGPTSFCTGGSVTLTSSSASGNQWYNGLTFLAGETNQTYVATANGNYNVVVTQSGCPSAPSASTAVTVTPVPGTPTITPGGPTTFCQGGSVTLTSSSATGNQWYNGLTFLAGETNQTYVATSNGNYNVVVTQSGCPSAPSASTTVTVTPSPATPTITPGGSTTFCQGGSVTLTSSSASGNQWSLNGNPIGGATNTTYVATASGNYTVVVTTSGCPSAPSAATTVTVNPIPPTPTITPGGPTTFCAGGSVTLTSSGASGNQWSLNGNPIGGATNTTYAAIASGNYTVVVTMSGCSSAPSSATTVTVNPSPATPTITPGGPTTFCTGGSVTLTSSGASGNQWSLNGNPIGGATNTTYVATASGNYTVVVTTSGCPSAPSAATTVTVNPIPATPTITPGGPTTFCAGGSVTLTSSSASGNQWYLNSNPIGGETNTTYAATASGNYTVVVTTSGCSSAPSSATTVTVNPAPPTPTITPGGPTTFCTGGSVTLTSSGASGNQWFLNGNPIGAATNTTYVATASGNYTVVVTTSGCASAPSAATTVTVNPIPPTPAITPGGPTTFCAGGSVTLTSSGASSNQWYLNSNPIGGATNTTYAATASGNYTVVVTTSGCSSAPSSATTVTVNPTPPTPAITPGGPTAFCAGGSVTLASSGASGNQWFLNGNPIGGATNTTYAATASGSYTVTVTTSGCSSAPSAAKVVTVNPNPNATITAPGSAVSGTTNNSASVANAGVGATYAWTISGGTITAGAGTPGVTFTAGAAGTLTLNVTVTTSAGCSDAKSANVNVTAGSVTVTSVSPVAGTIAGGSSITINGTGFAAGATVTFGGSAATNIVVVSAIQITARTPVHTAGAVNVTVTNTDSGTGTLVSGYLYKAQQFDPNGDGTITPMDIFYLINYLYMGGAPPAGAAGILSGDANGDGVVNPLDIFYLINYLFLGGPRPNLPSAVPGMPVTASSAGAEVAQMSGSITLGKPVLRDGLYVVPVIMTAGAGSLAPQAMALQVHFDGDVSKATITRAAAAKGLSVAFETNQLAGSDLSYLVSYGNLTLGNARSAVVAEIAVEAGSNVTLRVDPKLTMFSDQGGAISATVANGRLTVRGTTIRGSETPRPRTPGSAVN
jgi:hypothetical protein